MIYLMLFAEFFKVGLFTIGGGLAALPFLYELAQKHSWFTSEDVTNMIAISQSTPGPIGVNAATYFGYEMGGALGGIVATLGVIAPAIIISYTVAFFMEKFKSSSLVKKSFFGIRPAVLALISIAFLSVFKLSVLKTGASLAAKNIMFLIDFKATILFFISLVAIIRFKKHPVVYIIFGAIIGVIAG